MNARSRSLKLSPAEWERAEQIAVEHGGLPVGRVVAAGLFVLAEMPLEEAAEALAMSVEREPVRREGKVAPGHFMRTMKRAAAERLQELRNKKK